MPNSYPYQKRTYRDPCILTLRQQHRICHVRNNDGVYAQLVVFWMLSSKWDQISSHSLKYRERNMIYSNGVYHTFFLHTYASRRRVCEDNSHNGVFHIFHMVYKKRVSSIHVSLRRTWPGLMVQQMVAGPMFVR